MGIDFYMELTSPEVLAWYMDDRKMSYRALAAECLVRDRQTGRRKPLSHSMIFALKTGRARTCSPSTASAIEKALHAPPNILFTPKIQRRQSAA